MAVNETQILVDQTYDGAILVSGVSAGDNYFKVQIARQDGRALETTVSSGGYLYVSNGGVASGAHVYRSGTLEAYTGGIVSGATVEGTGTEGKKPPWWDCLPTSIYRAVHATSGNVHEA